MLTVGGAGGQGWVSLLLPILTADTTQLFLQAATLAPKTLALIVVEREELTARS